MKIRIIATQEQIKRCKIPDLKYGDTFNAQQCEDFGYYLVDENICKELWYVVPIDFAEIIPDEPKLNAPARVGGVVFRENIPWKTVIECAQRHYDYGQRDVQTTPLISPQNAIKLAMGQLILMPAEPTQEMYRAYIEGANPEESRNAAESFRNGYKEMIQNCQEK